MTLHLAFIRESSHSAHVTDGLFCSVVGQGKLVLELLPQSLQEATCRVQQGEERKEMKRVMEGHKEEEVEDNIQTCMLFDIRCMQVYYKGVTLNYCVPLEVCMVRGHGFQPKKFT